MGCIQSKTTHLPSANDTPPLPDTEKQVSANGEAENGDAQKILAFSEYNLNELMKATNGFSPDCIVSESGDKAPNVVYRGRLDSNRLIAVKCFSKQSWPDAQQFVSCMTMRLMHKIAFNTSSASLLVCPT
uniref:Uncharacterized protein n=1 Tax=Opuntia streptacantha TaxID=393608 RepID=A0A7C9EFL1_OPUST